MRRTILIALGGAVLILFIAGYHLLTQTKSEELTMRLKWAHQAQFAGFYAAKNHSFYSGLNIKFEPGGPDFPAVKMVVSGGEHFGVTGADQILLARSNGVPVVPLAVIYRDNPFVLFSPRVKTVKDLKDFANRRVGVKLGGNEELIYRAMMKSADVDTKTITEVPIKFDMTL